MYKKAVQTTNFWAFAYTVSMGGYALSLIPIGGILKPDDEPQFESVQSLESAMQEIAPLSQWDKMLFESLIEQNQAYL
jgi:hypothetical protein